MSDFPQSQLLMHRELYTELVLGLVREKELFWVVKSTISVMLTLNSESDRGSNVCIKGRAVVYSSLGCCYLT